MRYLTSALAAVLAGLSFSAAAQTGLPSVSLPADLDAVLRNYERAWAAKDATALARLFTADGLALQNGFQPARGVAAMEAHYANVAGGPLALRAIAYDMDGKLATIVGAYSAQAGQADIGKFVLVLKRGSDGQWRIAADIDNMNMRPRRPAVNPAEPPKQP